MPAFPSERTIVSLVGAIQLVNLLDFVMVMPLGPDSAARRGIPAARFGYLGGSSTAAAAGRCSGRLRASATAVTAATISAASSAA